MGLKTCVTYAKEHLQQLELLHIFDLTKAQKYYNEQKGNLNNPFVFGLKIADFLICNYKRG